jgi:phosphate-selective porin OprO/OprP
MTRYRSRRSHVRQTLARIGAVAFLLVAGSSVAGAQDSTQRDKPPSKYDQVWKFAEWYEDDSNPVVQQVSFTGRFQQDYATVDADEGNLSEWNVRRMRLGPRIKLFRTFTLHGEIELNPQEADPLYVRFTDLYVQWSRNPRLAVTVGKHGVPFTADGSTSSKELVTIDRSNLSNNIWFPQEYMPGVSVSGKTAPWVYRAGVYSAGAANRELGEFNGGAFTLGVLGYDFAKSLGVKEALLTVNYVYQHPDADNTFTRQLDHVVSLNFRYETARWGVRSDVSGASGFLGQSDLWGIMAMPFVNATDKLQFVGRYTFLDSRDPHGIRLATYESGVVTRRGDRYDDLYVGANYYFYGHKLKLQSGVQMADMTDRTNEGGVYSGVSWITGLRIGW